MANLNFATLLAAVACALEFVLIFVWWILPYTEPLYVIARVVDIFLPALPSKFFLYSYEGFRMEAEMSEQNDTELKGAFGIAQSVYVNNKGELVDHCASAQDGPKKTCPICGRRIDDENCSSCFENKGLCTSLTISGVLICLVSVIASITLFGNVTSGYNRLDGEIVIGGIIALVVGVMFSILYFSAAKILGKLDLIYSLSSLPRKTATRTTRMNKKH